MLIEIENNGQDIKQTSYWKTDRSKKGIFFASTNAGAIRLLVPPKQKGAMKIERERKGFYRAIGKKRNLRIVRRENGWYVEQYPVHGTGVIGPVKTLKEAKDIAELEGDE